MHFEGYLQMETNTYTAFVIPLFKSDLCQQHVNSKARLALFPDSTQLSVTCSFCSHVGRAWE